MRTSTTSSLALAGLALAGLVFLAGPRHAVAGKCQECSSKNHVSQCRFVTGTGFAKCSVDPATQDCFVSGYCADGRSDDGDEPWPWYY